VTSVDIPLHIWLTLSLFAVGGGFWAFDDFIAERFRINRNWTTANSGWKTPSER
jgi:hypothetical protein